jgi:uncharacterized repeat protein (TIGR03847 family)
MADAKYDFGIVDAVKPEAIGEPGQRRFRILLEGHGGSASLWLEKTQLFQLSMVIHQILATLSSEKLSEEHPRSEPTHSGREHTSMELDIGNLSVGHDPVRDLFIIEAYDREDDEEDEAILVFWASRLQVEGLANEAQALCAAGRPLCPLCSAPMGPETHICPKSNGHHSI